MHLWRRGRHTATRTTEQEKHPSRQGQTSSRTAPALNSWLRDGTQTCCAQEMFVIFIECLSVYNVYTECSSENVYNVIEC